MRVDHEEARYAFLAQLDTIAAVADGLVDRQMMATSHCIGWTVGDVLVHVHMGLQEMLLGLVSPTDATPDTGADTYWRHQPPATDDTADEVAGMRFVRLVGAAYRRPTTAVRHLTPTMTGVRTAVTALRPGAVRFQGLVLTTGDFLATWAVELAVHHLDLTRELTLVSPEASALRLGRRTIEALTGKPLPGDDRTVLMTGAGRLPGSHPPVLG
ncbi:MAG TPA: maleylpyruvate isomerase N-terminal domain-containing protein [Actinoplanes sp.]